MAITFPPIEAFDSTRASVAFPADVDGKRVRCLVSLEALQDHCNGDDQTPVDAFKAARGQIEAVAERKIHAGAYEPDGTVLLRTSDF